MANSNNSNKESLALEELQPISSENHVRKKRKTIIQKMLQHFQDYCGCTSIHGMGYFSQQRTCTEYFWWIFVITLSIFGSLFMIHQIYMKYVESPVIVSFATRDRPIYKIPFPAITLCPINKVDGFAFNLTEYVQDTANVENRGAKRNSTRTDIKAGYVGAMCGTFVRHLDEEHFNASDFFTFAKKNGIDLTFSFGFFGGEVKVFNDMFEEAFSPGGLCYTFNGLNLKEIYTDVVERPEADDIHSPKSMWDQEDGYSKRAGVHTYPRRALAKGLKNGLTLLIADYQSGHDPECNFYTSGYVLHLHYPSRVVTAEEGIRITLDSSTLISIDATMIETSPRVRNYPPSKRDCYFPSERSLKYFRNYTQKNCELECLTNCTLKSCGCVAFYMPRESSTPICGPGKFTCYKDIAGNVVFEALDKIIQEFDDKDEKYDPLNGCDCRPMCTDVQYKATVRPLKLEQHQLEYFTRTFKMDISGLLDFHYTLITIFFKDDKIMTRERHELYGPTDFISNFGGLMGLFTGFSILSSLEILYFLSLRIFGNIRLYGRWYGSNN